MTQPSTLSRKKNRAAVTARAGASWLALLAATSLGVRSLGELRADVRVDAALGDAPDERSGYRLIVQSYDPSQLGRDHLPSAGERPSAAAQRSVTLEQLRQGIRVSMVGVDGQGAEACVLAWVEPGHPDPEFDPTTARPLSGAYLGVARHTSRIGDAARVLLSRRV
jgi:hypothetical protein